MKITKRKWRHHFANYKSTCMSVGQLILLSVTTSNLVGIRTHPDVMHFHVICKFKLTRNYVYEKLCPQIIYDHLHSIDSLYPIK